MPLSNTVNDFWSMVYDYNCSTLVTITDEEEEEEEEVELNTP